ncbi:MAG: hypothetical protein AAFV53_14370 [Myxococcota bacterium]
MSKPPSRRTFTRLSLLGTAAFSLAPSRAFAVRDDLEPRLTAHVKDAHLMVDIAVYNPGRKPVEVQSAFGGRLVGRYNGGPRVKVRLDLLVDNTRRPLEFSAEHYTDLHGRKPGEPIPRSVRTHWVTIPTQGAVSLARMKIPWPGGVAPEGAHLAFELYVPTQEGYVRLADERLPIGPAER